VNRGVAMLGDTLFMGTIDAHLIAIDARSGQQIWNTKVATRPNGTRSRTHRSSSRTR
jgi:alcohol dehydrogenase (cytochrome c)